MVLTVDLLVSAKWIIPVSGSVLSEHTLVVNAGKIIDLLPNADVLTHYQAPEHRHLNEHALLPGFINAHTHAAMSMFRGYADDKPLMDWLQNYIWPAEAKWVGPEFVEMGVQLAIAEMLRSGTTCFHDMYFNADSALTVIEQSGIRASLGIVVIDFPTSWAQSVDEYLAKGLAIYQQNQCDRITFSFDPHAPYTVSDEPLQRILALSKQHQLPIQMHVHETAFEVEQGMQQGQRPLTRLDQLGLLNAQFQAVHMTQLNDAEIQHLAHTQTHVIHCPESNLKLASGFCPVAKLMQAGVNVALGTDGCASNNDLDMLSEMRTAALLAKGLSGDASALNAAQAIQMATLNGAKALGLEAICGSLTVGKAADFIAIDLSCLECQPLYEPQAQIVYAASRQQVTHVWVNGACLLDNRQLTRIDENALLTALKVWQQKIGASHA